MKKYKNILICLVILSVINLNNSDEITKDEYKIVKIESGLVRGRKLTTLLNNREYYSFKGIPYGQPPVKDLRFKAPKKVLPWNGTLDAFEFGNECIQQSIITKINPDGPDIVGEEDCLVLNVYSPAVSEDAQLSVMLYIHGGGFLEGSSNLYGPDFIIDENVILVTINYRLGVFGFMSLGTPEYSGNMGLKDQLLALKWVNRNIGYFGGDKNSITIFGESAGGACSHLHVMSSKSKNLFQRAIMMSGSSKNSWSKSPYNEHMLNMFAISRQLRYPVINTDDIIGFLKTVDGDTLIEYSVITLYAPGTSRKALSKITWAPVFESASAEDGFLIESGIDELFKTYESSVDTMFGFTSSESIMVTVPEIHNTSLLKPFDKSFEIELPLYSDVNLQYDSEHYIEIATEIRHKYFGENVPVDENSIQQYIDLLTDVWFIYGIDRSAKIQARKSSGNTFYYQFSVDTELNYLKKYYNITLPGAAHSEELCYLFRCNFPFDLYENIRSDDDTVAVKAIKNIAKLWTNFAKTGHPTPMGGPVEYKPIEGKTINFLDIKNEGLITGTNPRKEYIEFWNQIYKKYKSFLIPVPEVKEPLVKNEL